MDLPKREGTFVNEVRLEDIQKELFTDAPITTSLEAVTKAQAGVPLESIEPDESFLLDIKQQDPNEQIHIICNERLAKQPGSGVVPPQNSRNRSYLNTPNIDEYAIESNELKRLAAASHGVKAVVNSAVPVGLWHYEKCDATCVFCYEQLMGPCHKCLSDETPASACKIAVGICGHPIHIDCQNAWSGKNNCMTCQQAWQVKAVYSVFGDNIPI